MPDREPTQTVRQCADENKVTRQTVYNWIRKGAVVTTRTPGGGLRVIVEDTARAVKNV